MEFRIAREKDLERMCEITAQAKAGLKNLGLDQWQKGYPSREIWENDIKNQCTYVAEEDGIILGIFAFQTTPDISYYEIEGEWISVGPYAAMHRVCVAEEAKGKGVAGKMFAHGFRMAETLGFSECCVLIPTRGIFRCRERLEKPDLKDAERSIWQVDRRKVHSA